MKNEKIKNLKLKIENFKIKKLKIAIETESTLRQIKETLTDSNPSQRETVHFSKSFGHRDDLMSFFFPFSRRHSLDDDI